MHAVLSVAKDFRTDGQGCQSFLEAPYLEHIENNPAFLKSSLFGDLTEPVGDVEAPEIKPCELSFNKTLGLCVLRCTGNLEST